MRGFIEVTESKAKQLIAISEIKSVKATKKGNALLFFKEYYRTLFCSLDGEFILCKESYEEILAKIKEAIE